MLLLIGFSWLRDEKLPLMDVNTEDAGVISTLQDWIKDLTSTYKIDGLRIDGQLSHTIGSGFS